MIITQLTGIEKKTCWLFEKKNNIISFDASVSKALGLCFKDRMLNNPNLQYC